MVSGSVSPGPRPGSWTGGEEGVPAPQALLPQLRGELRPRSELGGRESGENGRRC